LITSPSAPRPFSTALTTAIGERAIREDQIISGLGRSTFSTACTCISTVTIIDNLKGRSMVCWEYQTQVITNTDCIPSRQVGLRIKNSLYAMLQHLLQHIRIHYERKSIQSIHIKPIKNTVAPHPTVKGYQRQPKPVSSGTSIELSS
jgi:hypothetical protein